MIYSTYIGGVSKARTHMVPSLNFKCTPLEHKKGLIIKFHEWSSFVRHGESFRWFDCTNLQIGGKLQAHEG